MLLQQQVVGCGDMIMLIRLDTSLCVLNVKVKLFQLLQYHPVDRNAMKTHHYTTI